MCRCGQAAAGTGPHSARRRCPAPSARPRTRPGGRARAAARLPLAAGVREADLQRGHAAAAAGRHAGHLDRLVV